ncbi:sensor histidine kinase [Actinomyces sp.]|uniref:sensor histidine kinase n=1 Tax=Actinomyces sp. TaxID=29317 RepID=UPI0026DD46D7|nr:histidine kinase [Actinomyces sp.]MDO4900402.1 histidine kinase [Actinomyces sp.]
MSSLERSPMFALPRPVLTAAPSRLRDAWRAHRELGVFTAFSLAFSALPVLLQRFSFTDAVGLVVPWALLLIPRHPLAATVILAAGTALGLVDAQGPGLVMAGWFATYALFRRGGYRHAVAIVVAMVAGNLLAWHTGTKMNDLFISQVLWNAICIGIAVPLRLADANVSRARAAQAQALREQRALIARELHDTLARANTQIVLRAQQAQTHLHTPNHTNQIHTALEDIITTGHQSVLDLRTMLRLLRQDTNTTLEPTPPTPDLTTTLAQARHDLHQAGLRATITHQGDPNRLTPTLTTTLTRILDECVANMIKYAAPDAQCTIRLHITDTTAELHAINPLTTKKRVTPTTSATSSKLGILGIQERTHALGGTTTITPTNHQWILHTTLPLKPTNEPQEHVLNAPEDRHRWGCMWSWLHAHWGLCLLTTASLVIAAVNTVDAGVRFTTLVGLVAPWALLLVPRRPWTAAIILALGAAHATASDQFTGTDIATTAAFCVFIRRGGYRQAVVIVVAMVSGNLLAWHAGHDMSHALLAQVLWLIICLGVASALRLADANVSRARAAQAQALREQRALIARELHDTLARANTQIVLRAQQAQTHLHTPNHTNQIHTALEDIITTGHQSVLDLRTMLRLLRQDTNTTLEPTPPTPDLTTTLAQARHDLHQAGLRATITHQGDPNRLTPTLTTTLTRILDECVANMIKYAAPDAQCTIRLHITDTTAELHAINPLTTKKRVTPTTSATSSKLGILGIQERTHALGGTTTITPTNHQWILHTTLPLKPTNDKDKP